MQVDVNNIVFMKISIVETNKRVREIFPISPVYVLEVIGNLLQPSREHLFLARKASWKILKTKH